MLSREVRLNEDQLMSGPWEAFAIRSGFRQSVGRFDTEEAALKHRKHHRVEIQGPGVFLSDEDIGRLVEGGLRGTRDGREGSERFPSERSHPKGSRPTGSEGCVGADAPRRRDHLP
jgi:hypothetical protein